ncbi:MAG TPA: hypothetical protein VIP28_11220 [Nocardioides sp.]
MTNTLADPADLADYPGAPFTQAVVDSAVAALRGDCGWHIAPEITETLTVNGSPDKTLILPTLLIVEITAIRDVSGDTPVVLTGWRMSSRAGLLRREEGWPDGFEVIEVDLTHGHTDTPADLLPAVAYYSQSQSADQTISTESLLSWSKTTRPGYAPTSVGQGSPLAILARYNVKTEN